MVPMRFEDQDAVQKPVVYATAAGDFDGDKGMTPVVNNRPGVPSNRDCEQVVGTPSPECGSGVSNAAACEALGCCFDSAKAPACYYSRLLYDGLPKGRCLRCGQDPANCFTKSLCTPRYCPYPAYGRMPWTHEKASSCTWTAETGIPLGDACTFQCKPGFISAAADYRCEITQSYVGAGDTSSLAVKQRITFDNVVNTGTFTSPLCLQKNSANDVVIFDECEKPAKVDNQWTLPPSSKGIVEWRTDPLDFNTRKCLAMTGTESDETANLELKPCATDDWMQMWFVPDSEGRIRSGGTDGTGRSRKCIHSIEAGDGSGNTLLFARMHSCEKWFDDNHKVYYQTGGTRWAKSIANFGVNLRQTSSELVCNSNLCDPGIFPKVGICQPGASQTPPACLDNGMVHVGRKWAIQKRSFKNTEFSSFWFFSLPD